MNDEAAIPTDDKRMKGMARASVERMILRRFGGDLGNTNCTQMWIQTEKIRRV